MFDIYTRLKNIYFVTHAFINDFVWSYMICDAQEFIDIIQIIRNINTRIVIVIL